MRRTTPENLQPRGNSPVAIRSNAGAVWCLKFGALLFIMALSMLAHERAYAQSEIKHTDVITAAQIPGIGPFGVLEFPQFDPTLGVLQRVDITVTTE